MEKININNLEETLFYDKLPNNLEVFLLPMPNKKSFYISFNVKYGNSNTKFKVDNKEIEVPSGVAHFLEHKLFERKDIIHPFKFFSASGTDVNAGTSIYYTNYYCNGNNQFKENLEYLLNWITKIDITDETVEKEKGIIIQESRMREDNPDILLYDRIRKNTFKKDPYGKRVIGTEKDILRITKEDLISSYNAFYRPDNMFIIVAGKFDPEETMNIIKNELKNFKNPKTRIEKIIDEEPITINKKEETITMDISTAKLAIGYKMNLNSFKQNRYLVDQYISIILKILFGNTSNFYENGLQKDLFIEFNYSVELTYDKVFVNFMAITNKPDELCKSIQKELKNIKIKEEDLERTKRVWIANEIKELDNISAISGSLLYDIINYGNFKNNKIDDYKNITIKEINKLIKELNFKNEAILKILPK